MKISTSKLKVALAGALRIAGKRTTLPILNCVALSASHSTLTVQASDLDCFITQEAECEGDLKGLCVQAKVLSRILATVGDVCEFKSDGKHLTIGSVKVPVFDPAEFPATPPCDGTLLNVNASELAEAISSVSWAAFVGIGASKPQYETVHIQARDGKLVCEAADGVMLAHCKQDSSCEPVDIAVPSRHIGELVEALSQSNPKLLISTNWATVNHESGSVSVKLSELVYINTSPIFTFNEFKVGTVKRQDLLTAFDTLLAVYDSNLSLACGAVFNDGSMKLTYKIASGSAEPTLDGEFKEHTCHFNPERMATMLRKMKADTVDIGAGKVCTFIVSGNQTFVLQNCTPNS